MNLQRILTLGWFIIICISVGAQQTLSKESLNEGMTYFYENPDTAKLRSILVTIRTDKQVRESIPPTVAIGFFTGILLSHNEHSQVVKQDLTRHRTESQIFETILYLGATHDTLVNLQDHSAEINDIMWAAYFGTGETKYLDRLITETQFANRQDSLNLFFAGTSAIWSLSSNARQHKSIDSHLRSRLLTSDSNTKALLTEILNTDPSVFRERTVAQIKEMKEKGLLPQPKTEEYTPAFFKRNGGGLIGFKGQDRAFSIEIKAKNIKPLDDPRFFDVDGMFFQATTISIPAQAQQTAEKEILNGYVQYELSYFKEELKLDLSKTNIEYETLNNKLFVKWSFVANFGAQGNLTAPKKHIYYSSVCVDRVISLSTTVMPGDNEKIIDNKMREIAKTLKLYTGNVSFE